VTPFPREAYRPLEPYAPDRRPVPVDLSDNTNLRGPHPAALRTVREAPLDALARYPSVYADRVRETVARRFGVPLEAVASGCGSDDLLDSAFRAAGEPGERIVFPAPTFSMIGIFARMNGMVPVSLPWPPGGPPSPEAILAEDPALIYLCRPNNPTGEVLPRKWVEAVVEGAGDRGAVVLVDEAYADFADDHFLREAAESRRLLVLRTLSKAYGLAGLRVGFAVGAPEVVAEVEKSRGPYKVNRLAEGAAVAALEDREEWIPAVVAEVRRSRARLGTELEARGFRPLPSGANFLLVPVPDAGAVTAALRDHGVAVRPFPGLEGVGDGVRVSVGPDDAVDAFLEAWDRLTMETTSP